MYGWRTLPNSIREVICMGILDLLRRKDKVLVDKDSYREFKSKDEVQCWGIEQYRDWTQDYLKKFPKSKHAPDLTLHPIENYCGTVYEPINTALWTGKKLDNLSEQLEPLLKEIIQSAPHLPEPVVVYRLEDERNIKQLRESLDKKTPFIYKVYMSTGLLMDNMLWTQARYSDRKTLLKIYVPAGTPAVYVNGICDRDENELLLQRDLNVRVLSCKYDQVIGQREDKNSRTTVNVRKNVYEYQILLDGVKSS